MRYTLVVSFVLLVVLVALVLVASLGKPSDSTRDEMRYLRTEDLVLKKYTEYGSLCKLDDCPDIRGAADTRLENNHLVMTRMLKILHCPM